MKKLSLALLISAAALFGQSTTPSTSLAAALDGVQSLVNLTSGTGVVAPSNAAPGTMLYVGMEGMLVTGNPSGTIFSVVRGAAGRVQPHNSGDLVWTASTSAGAYIGYDPGPGGCVAANQATLPVINTQNGKVWTCRNGLWASLTDGFQANNVISASVPSAAGYITPSGSLFHVTLTNAITGFNTPVGFQTGGFCIIPDGAFTTTNANNIAIASTAVVGRTLCYSYDPATAKWYPSY